MIGPDLGLIYLFQGVEWNFTFREVKEFFFTEDPDLCISEGDTFSTHLCGDFALKTGI